MMESLRVTRVDPSPGIWCHTKDDPQLEKSLLNTRNNTMRLAVKVYSNSDVDAAGEVQLTAVAREMYPVTGTDET